ncbi:winged helix-turn-helix domain-containing protein [Agrococcus sp. HG114]|uniref:winged helix-turn-helix domain-containing protein n=1 Tax=Agrococcus sp. HG114 TaxID=2969757 RepID=UPI00215A10FC|nr:winged helix-turn-helix domain-containing protein [Agrococcus sp. HG114]MCR8670574.1 winged helix-turn-helix domain-containing protein [Agrococcus sp. HG114]
MAEGTGAQGTAEHGGRRKADMPELRSSDPALLRALAHPLRVEILSVIDELGEATATQIAERVGESPSNCSFHLRTLAKVGFIERGEAQGTSKPWRAVHRGRDLRPDPSDPASMRASATIGALYVQHEAARLVEFFTARAEDPEWIEGTTVNLSTFWATAAELKELAEDIAKLTERFHGREADPETRPSGSRKVHFFGTLNPDPDSEPTP